MPRRCSICRHPKRKTIDQALVTGSSIRDIAGQFGLTKSAVQRHLDQHLPAHMVQAAQREAIADAGHLCSLLERIERETLAILDRNTATGAAGAAPSTISVTWIDGDTQELPADSPDDQPPSDQLALQALDRLQRLAALRARMTLALTPPTQPQHQPIGFTTPEKDTTKHEQSQTPAIPPGLRAPRTR